VLNQRWLTKKNIVNLFSFFPEDITFMDLINCYKALLGARAIEAIYSTQKISLDNSLSKGVVIGFCVARTRGTTRWTQRFERRGLNMGDVGSQQNTVMEASSHRTHNALQRETLSLTQV
jgi:hypothetical protein